MPFSFSVILFLILPYGPHILLFHNFCNLFGIWEYCRYRISLFSRWKQRGMYATCMWVVELLLVLSNSDTCFCYVPEFYLESLVNAILSFICSFSNKFLSIFIHLENSLISFLFCFLAG